MDNQILEKGEPQGRHLNGDTMKAIKDIDAKASIEAAKKDIAFYAHSTGTRDRAFMSSIAFLASQEALRAGIDPRTVRVKADSPLMKLSGKDLYNSAVQWTAIARYMNDKNQALVRAGNKLLTREEVATRAVAYARAGVLRELSKGRDSSLSLDNNERRGSGLSALLSGDREKQDRLEKDVTTDVGKDVSQKEIADNARSIFQQSLDEIAAQGENVSIKSSFSI